jgi:hypothetical protein
MDVEAVVEAVAEVEAWVAVAVVVVVAAVVGVVFPVIDEMDVLDECAQREYSATVETVCETVPNAGRVWMDDDDACQRSCRRVRPPCTLLECNSIAAGKRRWKWLMRREQTRSGEASVFLGTHWESNVVYPEHNRP